MSSRNNTTKLAALFFILILLFSSASFAATSRIADEPGSGSSPSTSTTHVYLNGKEITSIDSSGKRLFYHQDYLGSTRIITDVNGSLVASIDYTPYGRKLVDTAKTKYTFTGKEEDASELRYFGARYYDSEIGRFTQTDPKPDPTTSLYVYADNNPLRFVDPTGKKAQDAVFFFTTEIDNLGPGWGPGFGPVRTTSLTEARASAGHFWPRSLQPEPIVVTAVNRLQLEEMVQSGKAVEISSGGAGVSKSARYAFSRDVKLNTVKLSPEEVSNLAASRTAWANFFNNKHKFLMSGGTAKPSIQGQMLGWLKRIGKPLGISLGVAGAVATGYSIADAGVQARAKGRDVPTAVMTESGRQGAMLEYGAVGATIGSPFGLIGMLGGGFIGGACGVLACLPPPDEYQDSAWLRNTRH